MLDREWVSLTDPDEPHERYLFDVSFLTSNYSCIYGQGCPGTDGVPGDDRGCCRFGAHFVDDEDRDRTIEMVDVLGPEYMQHYDRAVKKGIVATESDGAERTRKVDGACIFLNRTGWHRGAGCALHHYAMDRDAHFVDYKPEVCWLVPLRREIVTDVADDGEERVTTTITSYDRGAWGEGGSDFDWWCTTDDDRAYGGSTPVYESMKRELTVMTSPKVYAELKAYLDDRRPKGRRPLPLLPQLPSQ
ncbi:hypothetical protein [Euzebya pacifica]|uniref:hypothetical protein n=1 Tax=Euzebya pacifica TaxID=1608957 RepID=UPI0030F8CFF3